MLSANIQHGYPSFTFCQYGNNLTFCLRRLLHCSSYQKRAEVSIIHMFTFLVSLRN